MKRICVKSKRNPDFLKSKPLPMNLTKTNLRTKICEMSYQHFLSQLAFIIARNLIGFKDS